ncbi:MAG: hypothetical protein R3D33_00750 [Hyphomicrobiaceae bacterium]
MSRVPTVPARVTPTATIIHHGGASEATRAAKAVKVLKAKATLIRRHFSPPLVSLALALNAVWPFSRRIAFALAARLGLPGMAGRAATWAEVWAARADWSKGYDAAATPPPRATPAASPRTAGALDG